MERDFMSKDYRTIGQILEQGLTEAKYTNVHNKIKNIKNLSRKEADMIANIDPAVLAKVIQNLLPSFKQMRLINSVEEDVELEEKFLQDLLTPDEFRFELENELELRGYSPKVIKKVTKKGKGYEVRVASYMKGAKEFEQIFRDMGATKFTFKKGGGVNIMLIERSALVANQTNILDVVLKDLHALLLKQMDKGNLEIVNNVARLVGLKVTTKGQGKNKAFMYDLEKGFRRK
tara:strand:+ start:327 stop:1022 length:696 start_codon:yes stop_codon:yes gene_type:complete